MLTKEHTLLLHCCCAPCTIVPLEALARDARQLSLYFYNPNIHPREEYYKRLSALKALVRSQAQEYAWYIGDYDVELWEERAGVLGGPYPLLPGEEDNDLMLEAKKKRCRACYNLRFEALAELGATIGSTHLVTTLTISPYQFTQEVHEVLESNAIRQGLQALESDWREKYAEATQRSRELGIYRQNYCGCRYSLREAELERQARSVARKTHGAPR